MPKLRVAAFSLSVDGFGAGPDQSLQDPLGKRGKELHEWFFATRTFQSMFGKGGGSTGVDEKYASQGNSGFGAFILGRNMFGPVRGGWPDRSWRGWWGNNPPYHAPTFILTHYPREPLVMEGGTTFHFVTGGIEEALERAKSAAGDKDIKIGGGVSTVRQYLQAGLIDEMHFAISPVVLGKGEAMFRESICRHSAFASLSMKRRKMPLTLCLRRNTERHARLTLFNRRFRKACDDHDHRAQMGPALCTGSGAGPSCSLDTQRSRVALRGAAPRCRESARFRIPEDAAIRAGPDLGRGWTPCPV